MRVFSGCYDFLPKKQKASVACCKYEVLVEDVERTSRRAPYGEQFFSYDTSHDYKIMAITTPTTVTNPFRVQLMKRK